MTRGTALLNFAAWCVLSALVWLYPVHNPMWLGYALRALAPLFMALYFRSLWKGPPRPPQTHSFRGDPMCICGVRGGPFSRDPNAVHEEGCQLANQGVITSGRTPCSFHALHGFTWSPGCPNCNPSKGA